MEEDKMVKVNKVMGKVNKVLEVLRDGEPETLTNSIFNGFRAYIDRGDLTPSEVIIIKWQYGYFGGFYNDLIALFHRADDDNRKKLKLSFPEIDVSLDLYHHNREWWDRCSDKAVKLGLVGR